MDTIEMTKLAYEMERAYRENKTQGQAIEDVILKHPTTTSEILLAMWLAIDAWVDMNDWEV